MRTVARRLANRTLETDLCVIGSGPAGLSLASEFVGSDVEVVVLESGAHESDAASQALSSGRTVGDRYADLARTRHRRVGGTPHIWNTWFGRERVAKYAPLDPIDFEARPWLPLSGWPIAHRTLDPYYVRARSFCGLAGGESASDGSAGSGARLVPSALGTFHPGTYQLGTARRFTEFHAGRIERAPNVLLCSEASVTDLETDFGARRVTRVNATTLSGERVSVSARCFVLAAGGIENARLLLLSNRASSDGLGNRHDMVGRCFMDHPRDTACVLIPRNFRIGNDLDFFRVRETPAGIVRGRLALSESAMRARRLHNLSITLRPRGPIELEIHLEQAPDPENRVVLNRTLDPLGQPRAELHWRWGETDRRNLARARLLLVEELARARVGRVVVRPGARLDPSAHHHMGTTRMSLAPRLGVVDPDCRVHGVANLFVAGSSVFPTGGFANPTLTIVALSLRLADHLKARLGFAALTAARSPWTDAFEGPAPVPQSAMEWHSERAGMPHPR